MWDTAIPWDRFRVRIEGAGPEDVEVDVGDVVEWTLVEGDPPDLAAAGPDGLRVVGKVVAVGAGDDPVVTIGVSGGLIMVEPGDEARRAVPIGATVSFTAPEFRLFPTGI